MEKFFLSNGDLKALSFVAPLRELIEKRSESNLRGLIEDDPHKWHSILSEVLHEVADSIKFAIDHPSNPLIPSSEVSLLANGQTKK